MSVVITKHKVLISPLVERRMPEVREKKKPEIYSPG
jgi:hypothetical protein